jgi:hypothetical protein
MLEAGGYGVERGCRHVPPGTTDEATAACASERGLLVISCDRGFGDICDSRPPSIPGSLSFDRQRKAFLL